LKDPAKVKKAIAEFKASRSTKLIDSKLDILASRFDKTLEISGPSDNSSRFIGTGILIDYYVNSNVPSFLYNSGLPSLYVYNPNVPSLCASIYSIPSTYTLPIKSLIYISSILLIFPFRILFLLSSFSISL
jgi:hypothetical protein